MRLTPVDTADATLRFEPVRRDMDRGFEDGRLYVSWPDREGGYDFIFRDDVLEHTGPIVRSATYPPTVHAHTPGAALDLALRYVQTGEYDRDYAHGRRPESGTLGTGSTAAVDG